MLVDSFQRKFSYLRLSLLPVCNFRCVYCLPNGNPTESLHKKHLTRDEIRRLLTAFVDLGITKVRLTGGEPTLRPDLISIVSDVAQVPGIEKVALTTNGYRLLDLANPLRDAGLTSLNVSVDSLNPKRFFEVTAHDRLGEILGGIKAAQRAGIQKIKVNTVVMKGVNDDEVLDLIAWGSTQSIDIRFIELMPTADNGSFFGVRHCDLSFIEHNLAELGWQETAREADGGPAALWAHPRFQSTVGLIRPYAKNFCDSCNRLRVTSEGSLQLCLFGSGVLPLRSYLQQDCQKEILMDTVCQALGTKKAAHSLHEGNYGSTRNLAIMGG